MKKKIENILTLTIAICLIGLSIGVLSQKNDYTEMTESSYVSSMGIDYHQDTDQYIVYLYILNNYNLSISDYGTSEANKLGYICKAKGSSIPDALSKLNRQSNIRLQYSHIRSVVIKDNFFNKKNINLFYNLIRFSFDFYPTFSIYTTSDDLMEVYNVKNFSDTSAYYTILINIDGLNKPKNTTFLNYANDILVPTFTSSYPVIKVKKTNFFEEEEELTSLDISGYSYINDDFSLSSFDFDNLRGLKHLDRLSKNVLSFAEFDYMVNEYTLHKKIKHNCLYIKITLRGGFISINTDKTNSELIDILKKHVRDDLQKLKETMDSYNIDVYNIDYLTTHKNSYLDTKLNISVNII